MKQHLFLSAALVALLIIAEVALASDVVVSSQAAKDEQTIWELERAYWRYVQENDLSAYSGLWHKDFLGWPSVSAAPVHKDHITDWITSQTSKGLAFKTGEFKSAAIQVTEDVAVACYWITFKWLNKDGNGAANTIRITHAWLRTGNAWRIIGGMSMPEPDAPRK
jgi:ketosteroid isomerase-like protein